MACQQQNNTEKVAFRENLMLMDGWFINSRENVQSKEWWRKLFLPGNNLQRKE